MPEYVHAQAAKSETMLRTMVVRGYSPTAVLALMDAYSVDIACFPGMVKT